MRNDEVIATIHFENERLVVRAVSQADADRILKIISVPYTVGTTKTILINTDEVNIHGWEMTIPGTKRHWGGLGSGGASINLFKEPEKLLLDWKVRDISLPTFQFQAEFFQPDY